VRWFQRFALACLWRAWRIAKVIGLFLFLVSLQPGQQRWVLYDWRRRR
jgi:hypothetical protein